MNEDRTQPARPTRPVHEPRTVAGRYVLLGELGRGGMGVVWRAQDQVIGRAVAVKELRLPDGTGDVGVFQERVLREVRTGGRLNDPAVVTVFDVVTESDATYIVMELVDAPTLSELVRREGPLPGPQVAAIGAQLLSALKAAHDSGIVHRDVKPGNVMVTATGRVKLTDFGIAQAVDDPRLTTSGMIVGSPAFMAPERVDGREAMPQSDLWSLGATLFFAVEGIVAFERPTTAATLHAIMTEVPYLTRCQGALASAIMGLLIASPEARITAAQAGGLLSVAGPSNGSPTLHHPGAAEAQPTRVASPPPRKRTDLRVGAAVAGVVLLVGGLFLGRAWGTPPDRTDPAMQPTMAYGLGSGLTLGDSIGYEDCYNVILAPGAVLGSDDQVSCDKSHTLEVYDGANVLGDPTSGDSKAVTAAYPGAEAVNRIAEARCAAGFRSSTIPAPARPDLSYRALVPSEAEWNRTPAKGEYLTRGFYCVITKAGNGLLVPQVHVKVK